MENVYDRWLNDQRYDTFVPRFFASIVDSLVLLPLDWLGDYFRLESPWTMTAWIGFSTLVFFGYFIVCHRLWGRTLGKRMMGVLVLDVSEERLLSLWQSFRRDAVGVGLSLISFVLILPQIWANPSLPEDWQGPIWLSLIAIGWVLAELLTMRLNDKRRAVHDLIAGSVVIRQSSAFEE